MNTLDKHIKVNNFLSVSILSNRSTARILVDDIREMNINEVTLDFSNIEFASRSFLDELNSLIKKENDITFHKTGMNNQVRRMDNLVLRNDPGAFSREPDRHKDANLIAM